MHGTLGNFYANRFIQELADGYAEEGIGLLTFNLRAHDGISEGSQDQQLLYVGGSISTFETCVEDIGAACQYVHSLGVQTVALQGHSLGCERVLAYRANQAAPTSLPAVLLCPVDTVRNQLAWQSSPHYRPNEQDPPTDRRAQDLVLSTGLYGALGRRDGWRYPIPITVDAFRSLFDSQYAGFFGEAPLDPSMMQVCLRTRGLIVSSPNDSFVLEPWADFRARLAARFPGMSLFTDIGSDHDLINVGPQVSGAVLRAIGR